MGKSKIHKFLSVENILNDQYINYINQTQFLSKTKLCKYLNIYQEYKKANQKFDGKNLYKDQTQALKNTIQKYLLEILRLILLKKIKELEKKIKNIQVKNETDKQDDNISEEDKAYFEECKKKDCDYSLYLGTIFARCQMQNIISPQKPSEEIINNKDIKCIICQEEFTKDLSVVICNGCFDTKSDNTSDTESFKKKHIMHSHCMNENLIRKLKFENSNGSEINVQSLEFQQKYYEIMNNPSRFFNEKTFECPSCRSTKNWQTIPNPYL